jgi:EAL domain-containing protein (putative c-di-GMP-specific phosphodiesterase class I)
VVLALLHELRGMGLRIALDDFGTGYSSLSYLRSFPFDKIKIDQSFVRALTAGAGSAAIVDAIVTLASTLGMTTTAEGVETVEQLEQVRRAGCTEAQGYHLGRPRPAADVFADLARRDETWPGAAQAAGLAAE